MAKNTTINMSALNAILSQLQVKPQSAPVAAAPVVFPQIPVQVPIQITNPIAAPNVQQSQVFPQAQAAQPQITAEQLIAALKGLGLSVPSQGQKTKKASKKNSTTEKWSESSFLNIPLYGRMFLGISVSSAGRVGVRAHFLDDNNKPIPTKNGLVMNKENFLALRNYITHTLNTSFAVNTNIPEVWSNSVTVCETTPNNYICVSVSSHGRIGIRHFFKGTEGSLIPTKQGFAMNQALFVSFKNLCGQIQV